MAGTHSGEMEGSKRRVVDNCRYDSFHCLSAYDWIFDFRYYCWLRLWVSDRVRYSPFSH